MEEENVRPADPTMNEQIVSTERLLSKRDEKRILKEIEGEVSKYMPNDEDTLDDLTAKLTFLQYNIFPQLYNFRIFSQAYDNVYIEIEGRIRQLTSSEADEDEGPTQPNKEEVVICDETEDLSKRDLRTLRLKYYASRT